MKKYLALMACALSFGAFANGIELACKFTINENKTSIDELERPVTWWTKDLAENASLYGNFLLKEVMVNPGSDDSKEHNIVLMKSDKSLEKIKDKGLQLVEKDLDQKINYEVVRESGKISVKFEGSKGSTYERNFFDDRKQEGTITIAGRVIDIECSRSKDHKFSKNFNKQKN
jgi:hypothetical protein